MKNKLTDTENKEMAARKAASRGVSEIGEGD